jgi:sporulation protein YlmC with PRC-barrel domain
MKTHRHIVTAAFAGTFALLLHSPAGAQAPNPSWNQPGQRTPMHLQLASAESDAFGLSQLAGKPVRGANQEQLGTVSDFLVEPKSGRIHYAIVPSGAGAAGETFRLVPVGALEPRSGVEGITVRIAQAQWDQVGTMTQAELPARVSLNDEQRQRLTQQFAVANQPGFDAGNPGELVRASSLRGQALRSGNDQVGTIEDVAIDVRRRTAAAVLRTAGGFSGAEQRFLVPFHQLQVTGDAGAGLTTALGRNEFQQAQGALTPTGYTSGPFTRGGESPHRVQASAQQAVNQAGGGGVQVAAETWLILRGTVDSEQKRAEVERAVQQAAPGMPIDNKVTVQNP